MVSVQTPNLAHHKAEERKSFVSHTHAHKYVDSLFRMALRAESYFEGLIVGKNGKICCKVSKKKKGGAKNTIEKEFQRSALLIQKRKKMHFTWRFCQIYVRQALFFCLKNPTLFNHVLFLIISMLINKSIHFIFQTMVSSHGKRT